MKTLREHNKESHKARRRSESISGGVLCDFCGQEMTTRTPSLILLTSPAKQSVECLKCDVLGYKIL